MAFFSWNLCGFPGGFGLISLFMVTFGRKFIIYHKGRLTDNICSLALEFGRHGGLMVSAVVSGSKGPGSSFPWGHCVVFLARHSTFTVPLHPGSSTVTLIWTDPPAFSLICLFVFSLCSVVSGYLLWLPLSCLVHFTVHFPSVTCSTHQKPRESNNLCWVFYFVR